MDKISILFNTIMNYEWGSKTFISKLAGKSSPSIKPEAEMWMGGHERSPSTILYESRLKSLDKVITKYPFETLGHSTAIRFHNRLPFLFKVISAEKPLSIQAHPDRDQAEKGFIRENLKNVPIDAPERNYRDSNHKPELICALEPVWAMNGFRNIQEILRFLEQLNVANFEPGIDILKNQPNGKGLKRFFINLMSMERAEQKNLVRRVVNRINETGLSDSAFVWVRKLSLEYTDDAGSLFPMFLNIVNLEPGEALFINSRELHSYLKGSGLEIMANSDNVLRGGLTQKHIDLSELTSVLSFEPSIKNKILPEKIDRVESVYKTPAKEFILSVIDLTNDMLLYESPRSRSAEIIINIIGDAEIRYSGSITLVISKGTSVFIPASVKSYSIRGKAVLYKVSVPVF